MNGWFQWRSENWPPSEYIYPLLISMHISPLKADDLLKPEGIEFLKKYGPVGCRDHYTQKLLESKGVPSYFSACMTLTLGKNYSIPKDKHKGIYIVDPFFEVPDVIKDDNGKKKICCGNLSKGVCAILQHFPSAYKLSKNQFLKCIPLKGFLIEVQQN